MGGINVVGEAQQLQCSPYHGIFSGMMPSMAAALSATLACAFTLRPTLPRHDVAPRASIQLMAKLVTNKLAATTEGSSVLPAGPLCEFLASTASDLPLLSAASVSGPVDGVYECELSPITFFKLSITPLFTMRIDREAGRKVTVRVLQGRCRVGEKLSRTITIGALNTLEWAPATAGGWQLDTFTSLELAVKQAPMNAFALKAWEVAGNAIVKGACEQNARGLLANIEAGYLGHQATLDAVSTVAEVADDLAIHAASTLEAEMKAAAQPVVDLAAETADTTESAAEAAVGESVAEMVAEVTAMAKEAVVPAAEETMSSSMSSSMSSEVLAAPRESNVPAQAPDVESTATQPVPEDTKWRKRRLLFGDNVRRFILFGERLQQS